MDLSRSAIVLLGFQNDVIHPEGLAHRSGLVMGDEASRAGLLDIASRLIDRARAAGLPVVWVDTVLRADHLDSALASRLLTAYELTADAGFLVEGSWGAQLVDVLEPRQTDVSVVKKGHSAFQATSLDRVLANMGVDTCICIAGGFLDDLVQTMGEGAALGYEMVVPVDGISQALQKHSRMWRHRGTVTTSAEIVEEIAAARTTIARNAGGTALLVIDLQNDFLHPQGVKSRLGYSKLGEEERSIIIENNQALCRAARSAGRPVIFAKVGARQDNLDRAWARAIRREMPISNNEGYLLEGSWGAEVVEGVDVHDDDFQVTKKGNSAFGFTPLHRILRNLNVTTCVVSGGAVHGCIEATVREGVGLGYSFVVVPDAAYPPNSLVAEVLGSQTAFMTVPEAVDRLTHDEPDR